jgi:hypothetical protein
MSKSVEVMPRFTEVAEPVAGQAAPGIFTSMYENRMLVAIIVLVIILIGVAAYVLVNKPAPATVREYGGGTTDTLPVYKPNTAEAPRSVTQSQATPAQPQLPQPAQMQPQMQPQMQQARPYQPAPMQAPAQAPVQADMQPVPEQNDPVNIPTKTEAEITQLLSGDST